MMRLLSCLYKGIDFSGSVSTCLLEKQQSSKQNEGCNSAKRLLVLSYELVNTYACQHHCMLQHICCYRVSTLKATKTLEQANTACTELCAAFVSWSMLAMLCHAYLLGRV